jgi:hypothetical protein
MQCSMRNQCSGLFIYIMNYLHDSYLELCTMYDSYGVYLCVLWTICMYKFNRCHVVVFTVFSFHERRFSGGDQPHFGVPGFHYFYIVSGAFQPNFLDFH